MTTTLTDRTVNGLNWNFLREIFSLLFNLTVGVILARLISPRDFGLLAMATILSGLASQLTTFGMGPAIIQSRSITEAHIRVAFTVSSVIGVCIAIFLWILAYPLSRFFAEPDVLWVARIASLTFLFSGFSTISMYLLRRSLNFKALFYIDSLSLLIAYAGCAIPLALNGYGVWSLLVGILAQSGISCFLFLVYSRLPMRPLIQRKAIIELTPFAAGATLNGLIYYTSVNIDRFIIGKLLSATALGLYNRAFRIATLPQTSFSFSISAVLFPAYSSMQDSKYRLADSYLKAVSAASILAFPILTCIAISARYVVVGIYGSSWSAAIIPLQLLCFAGLLKGVLHLCGSVVYATGKVYSEIWRQSVYLVFLGIGCLLGVSYGIQGVAFAVIISTSFLYFSMAQLVLNILGKPWASFFAAQLPGFVIACIVGLINLIIIYFLESLFSHIPAIFVLLFIFFGCLLAFSLCLIFLPATLKGEMPAWLANRYSQYIPVSIRPWLLSHL